MNTKWLLVILSGVVLTLLSLIYTRTGYEANVLGTSDFALGRPGNCAKVYGFDKCYDQVEYRGYPLRIIKIESYEKNGSTSKTSSVVGRRGESVTTSILIYSGLTWLAVTAYNAVRKKSK